MRPMWLSVKNIRLGLGESWTSLGGPRPVIFTRSNLSQVIVVRIRQKGENYVAVWKRGVNKIVPYLLQPSASEGGREDGANPLPFLISDCYYGRLQFSTQAKVLSSPRYKHSWICTRFQSQPQSFYAGCLSSLPSSLPACEKHPSMYKESSLKDTYPAVGERSVEFFHQDDFDDGGI